MGDSDKEQADGYVSFPPPDEEEASDTSEASLGGADSGEIVEDTRGSLDVPEPIDVPEPLEGPEPEGKPEPEERRAEELGHPSAGEKEGPSDTGRGRRAVLFSVVFLIVTAAALAAYRYSVNTKANHAYLYSVAFCTSKVLGFVGDSSDFEQMGGSGGNAQGIRAALRAWESKGAPPVEQAVSNGSQPPLTRWESYRYRALKAGERLRCAEQCLAALEPLEGVEASTWQEYVAAVRARVDQVERGSKAMGVEGTIPLAAPGVLQTLEKMHRSLDEFTESGPGDYDVFTTTMKQMEEEAFQLRSEQIAYLRARIDVFRKQVRNMGPLVRFVAARSPAGELTEAEARMAELKRDAGVSGQPKAPEAASLEAEVERLKAQRAQYEAENQMNEFNRGRMFSFTVISECGAIESMAIFLAAVLAFPCGWGRRLIGVVLGLPLLYAVNVGRLACLAIIGAMDESGNLFRFVHEYLWQAVYVIFVIAVWLLWARLFAAPRKAKQGRAGS